MTGSVLLGPPGSSTCRPGCKPCDPSGEEEEKSLPGPWVLESLVLTGTNEVAVSSDLGGAQSDRQLRGHSSPSALEFSYWVPVNIMSPEPVGACGVW